MPDRALNLSKRVYDKVVSPHSKMDRIKNAEKDNINAPPLNFVSFRDLTRIMDI